MKKNKGFTLLEMVIVLAVIAILTAILIPAFSGIIAKAQKTKAKLEITDAVTNYVIDNAFEEFGEIDARFIIVRYKDKDGEHYYHQNDEKQFEELNSAPAVLKYAETSESSVNKNITIYDFSRTEVFMRAYLLYELATIMDNETPVKLSDVRFYTGVTAYKHQNESFIELESFELKGLLQNIEIGFYNDFAYPCEEFDLTLYLLG